MHLSLANHVIKIREAFKFCKYLVVAETDHVLIKSSPFFIGLNNLNKICIPWFMNVSWALTQIIVQKIDENSLLNLMDLSIQTKKEKV